MGQNLTGLTIASTFEDLVQISGSILTDGTGSNINNLTVTSSFATTASFALNATSASYAVTASFALNSDLVNTGSLLTTASINNATITFTKGDASTFSIAVNNVVNASTASIATTATTASYVLNAVSASFATTAQNAVTATTATTATTASYVLNAVSASFATTATTASYVLNAVSASFATTAQTAVSASYATTAQTAVSASYATTASHVQNAVSASYATTATSASYATTATSASFASTIPNGLSVTFNSITASTAQFTNLNATSASFGYVETVTGSAVIIGDAFIILNADTPTAPYAGLMVYDTGSASTASLEWNGNSDYWITVEESGKSAMILTGISGSKGVESAPTLNKLLKGQGNNTVADSSITDNGTNVTFSTPISGTQITASTGFNGNLTGTASFATSATTAATASSTPNALITASATGATITFTKGDATTFPVTIVASSFPFTGSAQITGSLGVTGSLDVKGNSTLIGSFYQTGSIKSVGGIWMVTEATATGSMTGFPNTNFIVGGHNQTVSAGDGFHGVFGAPSSTITSAGDNMTLLGGSSNGISNSSQGVVIGGISNTLQGTRSFIIGGYGNNQGNLAGASADYGGILGGSYNINNGSYSTLIGGLNNTIANGIVRGVIIGSSASLSNHNGSVIIGGANISSSVANTVYTPNIVISGSAQGVVNPLTISSLTASLDCSLSNFYTLTLVSGSNTYINPSNIASGQTINLKLVQPNPGNGTVSFPSSVKQVSGSAYVPTTGSAPVDVVTFISFDTSALYLSNIKNLI